LDFGGGQNVKSAVSDNSPVYCFSRLGEIVFRAMAIHDLAVAYQTKTDEELLHLADSPEQLTPEAQSALKSELAKR
jgi:hypothetical protein